MHINTPAMIPGITPDIRSLDTEVPVVEPYTTNTILGGITIPRVPPATGRAAAYPFG